MKHRWQTPDKFLFLLFIFFFWSRDIYHFIKSFYLVMLSFFLSFFCSFHLSFFNWSIGCCSIAKLCPTLRPHGLQHTRLLCPSPSLWVCSDLGPLSWCHSNISSSVAPFSSCPQSFSASESFPMNLLFASSGQSVGALASASVLPMTIQGWFPEY